MRRYSFFAFAVFVVFTLFAVFAPFPTSSLLTPPPLLAAEKKAAPKVAPKVFCQSPMEKEIAPKKTKKIIIRVRVKANIRWGPGESFEKIFDASLPKNYPLEALCRYEATFPDGKKEAWYYARDFEGFMGWVSARVVEKGGALIVKVKKARARSGPSLDKSEVWELPKFYTLKALGKKGQWYHVEDDAGGKSEKAWIHQSVVWGGTN